MLAGSREAESDRKMRSIFHKSVTHLLHGQAALCTWEPLYQDGPQESLPQTCTIHLRGQPVNLGCGELTGLVGQLGGVGDKRLMI